MATSDFTQARLKELLHYNPDTGLFTRRVATGRHGCHHAGIICGSKTALGYIETSVANHRYLCHRIAFLYMTGRWPTHQVDHINHIRHDNRWINLREATVSENRKNRVLQTNNKSGTNGVHKWGKRWRATIQINYKIIHLGIFTTIEKASQARKEADEKYNFHINHGCTPSKP